MPPPNHPQGPRGGGGQHQGGARDNRGVGQTSASANEFKRPETYLDGNAKRPALFDGEAQAEAKLWADSRITTTQVRRFFGATMAHLRRIDLGQSDDLDTRAAMALMKASANYAAARRKDQRDPDHGPIRDFFEHHARLVKTQADFRLFATHFEAVVAYHRAFESKQGGG